MTLDEQSAEVIIQFPVDWSVKHSAEVSVLIEVLCRGCVQRGAGAHDDTSPHVAVAHRAVLPPQQRQPGTAGGHPARKQIK